MVDNAAFNDVVIPLGSLDVNASASVDCANEIANALLFIAFTLTGSVAVFIPSYMFALTAMNLAAQWVLKLVVGSVDPKDGYSVVQ